MKKYTKKLLTFMLALTLTCTTFVGCMGEDMDYADDYKNSSSSQSNSITENKPFSEAPTAPSIPYEPYEDSFDKPADKDVPDKNPGNITDGYPNSENSSSTSEKYKDNMNPVEPKVESKNTISTDFSEIGALDKKEYNWGPGGPVDDLNRSCGAVQYNNKFKDYDAYFIGQDNKNIYLTFDEGYEFGITDDFLDILKEKNVKATFFLTYDFAKREHELIKRMIDEGHTLGNHSKTHKNYSTLTPVQVAEDAMFMQDYIEDNFNYTMKYFRCPSGNFNEQTLGTLKKLGFKSIFWSFAYKDWLTDKQPNPKESLEKLKKSLCVGNIYLLHAVSETNLKILPDFIDYARQEGYTFASLDELNLNENKENK